MKIIAGLGNPGAGYERTRHNAGFMAIDRLTARHAPGAPARGRFHAATLDADVAGVQCLLMKPTTYMNRSGLAVGEAVRFYKVDPTRDVLVIVDDVALPAGAVRLREEGGDGGHNGLADITRALGTTEFARCRVGVDRPTGGAAQHDYVLSRFSPEQWTAVEPALDRAADVAEMWAREGAIAAMNKFNTRVQSGWGSGSSEQDPRESDRTRDED